MKRLLFSIIMIACLGWYTSQAQRVNAEGRKMVKCVKYYAWRGAASGYELQETFSMEYNDKNELVIMYQNNNRSYIRKGDKLILKDGDGIKCEYKFNSLNHVTSATEYYLPLSKSGIEPYYMTFDFTYNPDGTLFSLVSKTLYNTTGRQYKENREDRDVIQFEYRDGGMYSFIGGVSSKGIEYLIPHDKYVREYDTQTRYDINFNIEAREFARCFREYMPFCTEWSPTFPECLIRKTDNGGNIRLYNWEYDQNGNIIAMTITYGSLGGGTHGRYEIEYVY